jgi:hypothetical protein
VNRRSQRGTIDNRPLLWIVPILVLVGWYNWPGGRSEIFTPTVATWLIAGGAALVAIFAIGFYVTARGEARDAAHRREVAQAVGSKVELEFQGGWGQTSAHYYVPMRRHDYPVKLAPTRGSTVVVLEVDGGGAPRFAIDVAPDGAITAREAGREAAETFLDERVRSNLASMAKIGKPAGLAILVAAGPDRLSISRYGAMSVEETLLFLDLCWPVVDRALALCYGKPV